MATRAVRGSPSQGRRARSVTVQQTRAPAGPSRAERGGLGQEEHVGFEVASAALDGRAVKGDPIGDGGVVMGGGEDHGVAGPEDVDEDEPDPVLLLVVGQRASRGD